MVITRFKSGVLGTNSYIITGNNNAAIVIDPGFGVEDQLKYIDANGLRILGVFLTHGHFDHVHGVTSITSHTGAKTYMSSNDVHVLDKINLYSYVFEKCASIQIPRIDNYVSDGDIFVFESIVIKSISTPGHTPGSICYMLENNLFTGDALEQIYINNRLLPGVDPLVAVSSKKMILQMNEEITIYPGHGSNIMIKDYKNK